MLLQMIEEVGEDRRERFGGGEVVSESSERRLAGVGAVEYGNRRNERSSPARGSSSVPRNDQQRETHLRVSMTPAISVSARIKSIVSIADRVDSESRGMTIDSTAVANVLSTVDKARMRSISIRCAKAR